MEYNQQKKKKEKKPQNWITTLYTWNLHDIFF